MTTSPAKPIAALAPLLAAMLLALALGLAVALGLGKLAAWTGSETQLLTLPSAVLGTVAVLIAAIASVAILAAPASRTKLRLGICVMLASSARMLITLAAGLGFYFIMSPEPRAFFAALLAAGTLTLAFETAWAVMALKRSSQADSNIAKNHSATSPHGVHAA